MNIDFIKWMVSYAKGFESGPKKFQNISFNNSNYISIKESMNTAIYPLLLQRAIEGINRENKNIEIVQEAWCINLLQIGVDLPDFEIVDNNEDQAKEEALKYIWELAK